MPRGPGLLASQAQDQNRQRIGGLLGDWWQAQLQNALQYGRDVVSGDVARRGIVWGDTPLGGGIEGYSRAVLSPWSGDRQAFNEALGDAIPGGAFVPSGLGGGLLGQVVWHGSPHKWDVPDISKVGTGDGSQVYGHGFYSAESPEVAKSYQRIKPDGSLYKLDIPDDDVKNYLDFGKPLKDQPEVVDHLRKYVSDKTANAPHKNILLADENTQLINEWLKNPDEAGYVFYSNISDFAQTGDFAKNQQAASLLLQDAGIRGIRYLDSGSRGAGQGTYNYVTFDPSRVKVLERNGQPVGGLLGTIADAGKAAKAAPYDEALRIAQQNAALPVEKGGLGLPPNNTPMDRARAMGFEGPWYHGTNKDFPQFDVGESSSAAAMGPGAYLSKSPEDAGRWAKTEDSANVMPLMLRGNVLPMVPMGNDAAQSIGDYLGRVLNIGDPPPYWSLERRGGSVSSGAKEAGFSAVEHAGPGKGVVNMVVSDPTTIRSRFAAFDPARRDSADLLASLAALGLLGGGAGYGLLGLQQPEGM